MRVKSDWSMIEFLAARVEWKILEYIRYHKGSVTQLPGLLRMDRYNQQIDRP